jgi:hypothetical protein
VKTRTPVVGLLAYRQTNTAVVIHIHILPHSCFSVTTIPLVFEATNVSGEKESLNKLRHEQITQKWNGETNGYV